MHSIFAPAAWLDGVPQPDTVLIVLNQPIQDPQVFENAWKSCPHRIVTDGAANRLRELGRVDYVPDVVIGDFDSIYPSSREHYVEKGVPFVTDEDQYATDFMKAMKEAHKRWPSDHITFLAFGGLGGRVDHTWHAYLNLVRAQKQGDRLILISDQSITTTLPAGLTEIATPLRHVGPTCGFAPLMGATASITTKGFEWDVENWPMDWGSQISTSNLILKDTVTTDATESVLFTMEIRGAEPQAKH